MTNSTFPTNNAPLSAYWVCLFFIIIAGLISPRLLAYMPALMGLGYFAVNFHFFKDKFLKLKKEIFFLVIFCALAFCSAFWSPNTDFSIERSIKIVCILCPGLFFILVSKSIKTMASHKIFKFIFVTQIIVSLLFMYELVSWHQIMTYLFNEPVHPTKFSRSHVFFSFLILFNFFIIQNCIKNKKVFFFCVTALISIGLFYLTKSQTAQITLLVGLAFLYFFPINNAWIYKALVACVVIFSLVFPFTIKPLKEAIPEETMQSGILKEASIMHRLEVWNYAAEKILESPIYGQGIEALRFMKSNEWMKYQNGDNALHAHNSILQIWAEFGLIGILLGLVFLLYIFRNIYYVNDPIQKKLYLAIFMAALACSLTGYGLWQSWQLGLFVFITGATISIGQNYKVLGSKNQ